MMSLATNPAVCMALTQRCKTALLESTLLYQQVQETNDELVFCLPHRIVGLSLVHNGILKNHLPISQTKKKEEPKRVLANPPTISNKSFPPACQAH